MRHEKAYPKTIRVGNHDWRIVFVPKDDDRDWFGRASGSTRTIHLERGQGRTQLFETLLHEIMHAIEWEYGLQLCHDAVSDLEIPIRRLLTENPPLLGLITGLSA